MQGFARRVNSNGSQDVICTTCFVTVGTSNQEAELCFLEFEHRCSQRLLAGREKWDKRLADGYSPRSSDILHSKIVQFPKMMRD